MLGFISHCFKHAEELQVICSLQFESEVKQQVTHRHDRAKKAQAGSSWVHHTFKLTASATSRPRHHLRRSEPGDSWASASLLACSCVVLEPAVFLKGKVYLRSLEPSQVTKHPMLSMCIVPVVWRLMQPRPEGGAGRSSSPEPRCFGMPCFPGI